MKILIKISTVLPTWHGDPERVILCGQSAGGNLLAAISQRKKAQPELHLLAQFLCYPPADNYNDHFHGEDLDPRSLDSELYGFFYNASYEERKDPAVSLVYATKEDLTGIIPTHIMTAELDGLTPDAEKYYHMLQEAGIEATYHCYPDSRHGFLVNMYDAWQDCEDDLVRMIQNIL